MALEGTVKLPVFGTVRKQTAALSGAGAAVFVVGIYWYRARKASRAAAATAPPGGQQTDPAGNTGAIDPATGYVYGSSEDQQALAGAAALGAPYDASGLGAGLTGYYYGSGGATQAVPPGPGNFADNAEWAQYVEAYMIGTLNADPAAVGNAIGKYLTGQPLTSDQVAIVTEAIAIGDKPPQPGANGDPPGYATAPGTAGGGSGSGGPPPPSGGTGGGGPTPPPYINPGGPAARGAAPPQVTGLHVIPGSVTRTGLRLAWNPSSGAQRYQVRVTYQGHAIQDPFVTGTSYTVNGLAAGRTYGLHVVAIAGSAWAPEASTVQKTSS